MFNIGRQGDAWCVNESGLYSLILSSRKPQAKKFKKWVTSDVLPSIRKTGSYSLDNVTQNKVLDLLEQTTNELKEQRLLRQEQKEVHPGLYHTIYDLRESVITTNDYCIEKGIDESYKPTIARRAATLHRIATGHQEIEKTKGTSNLIRRPYLDVVSKGMGIV